MTLRVGCASGWLCGVRHPEGWFWRSLVASTVSSLRKHLAGCLSSKQPGSRVYFDAGPVTLQVVDVSSAGKPHPAAKALYFTVKDLDAAFARAKSLGCLSRESVHDAPGGGIVVRPWGERSFYADDPWSNPLCFVEEGTVYTG